MTAQKNWFRPDTDAGRTLVQAWLDDLGAGDRADLRRATSTLDSAFAPAFHRLRWRIAEAGCRYNADALAVAASLAVSVKATGGQTPAAAFGRMSGGRPALSELRLRRLAGCSSDPFQALVEFRRSAAVVDGEISPTGLFALAYRWCIPALHDSTRRTLLFDYYDTTQQATS